MSEFRCFDYTIGMLSMAHVNICTKGIYKLLLMGVYLMTSGKPRPTIIIVYIYS